MNVTMFFVHLKGITYTKFGLNVLTTFIEEIDYWRSIGLLDIGTHNNLKKTGASYPIDINDTSLLYKQ